MNFDVARPGPVPPSFMMPVPNLRARLDRLRVEISALVEAEEQSLRQARQAARRRQEVLRSATTPAGVYEAFDVQLGRLESLLLAG